MHMKKILGLDLGVASIGWALIKEENEQPKEIIGMGVRIVPLTKDETDEFSKGNKISKNHERTQKRTSRKVYYRYVLRRKALTSELRKKEMFDPGLFKLPQLELWGLRAKAVTEKISLTELGRVLYHLNQKRGYKSAKAEENVDKKDTEYVAEVKNRYEQLKTEGLTIGQKFFAELKKNQHYRTKQQVFPREAYIDEYNQIMRKQQEFYPDVLSNDLIEHIRDNIIYFQRKLKSQKGLVSVCEFEGFHVKTSTGKEIFTGPKVAHRSNPVFQIEKIWETINNIRIKNKYNEELSISPEQKQKIFEYLDNNEKLSFKELLKILGIKEKSGWYGDKMLSKGLQGNLTKEVIKRALGNESLESTWLQFNLKIQELPGHSYLYNKETGEVILERPKKIVDPAFTKEPLYQLWHTIYSISDIDECKKALKNKFNFDDDTAERLAKIDFSRQSFGNKSVKAMRKILPYLIEGFTYSDAASLAGYNHSISFTKDEIASRILLDKIPLLKKNALRQPVVEKILNQMIHIVNEIIDEKRGWVTKEEREKGFFEIRVELSRELKQSQEERNNTFKNISRIERENNAIAKTLEEMGVRATRKNIIKYRLFNEVKNDDKKLNAMCIYTGKIFSLTDALSGNEIDVEHIIPRSLLFDDSQSNKTLTFRWVNQEKGDRTAFDYMASKGEAVLNEYVARVNKLFEENIINKAKRDKLLLRGSDIPQDFIERQLRQSQYISRKSREILSQIAKNVWSTSGSVTEYLRRLWGWDDVLMNLQMERIRQIIPNALDEGITEIVEWETENGQKHKKEVIKGWTKRDDHRHHAIDALVVACTKQGFIQRLNTLSAKATKDQLYKEVNERKLEFRESLSLLDKYFISKRPFTTRQVENKAAEIIISLKPGKKVATYGKRFIRKNGKRIIAQKHVLVPRGPLSEESVYGKIKIIDTEKDGAPKKHKVKYLFENPHLIFKQYIRELVERRLEEHQGETKKAIASLKNNPIYLDEEKRIPLQYATCFKEEFVVKYPITSIKEKDLPFVIDKKVREILSNRIKQFGEKEAFKETVYLDEQKQIPIRTVRLATGLEAVESIKADNSGQAIGFVKPGNNHHIAIYEDNSGEKIPHLCTFWHAVERKKFGLPVIIEKPNEVWNYILNSNLKFPEEFLAKLPKDNLSFLVSLQQNELFILEFDDISMIQKVSLRELEKHIYRVQKIFYNGKQLEIFFRSHIETQLNDSEFSKKLKRFYAVKSLGALEKLNPIKIKVNYLGEITLP